MGSFESIKGNGNGHVISKGAFLHLRKYVIWPCIVFQNEPAGYMLASARECINWRKFCKLVIRTDESTSRYAIYFQGTDQKREREPSGVVTVQDTEVHVYKSRQLE